MDFDTYSTRLWKEKISQTAKKHLKRQKKGSYHPRAHSGGSAADTSDSGSFGLSECKEYGHFAFSKLWKNKRGMGIRFQNLLLQADRPELPASAYNNRK